MTCPFCDAAMEAVDGTFRCVGDGPLLLDGDRCPYQGDVLSEAEIQRIAVALIDAEMD